MPADPGSGPDRPRDRESAAEREPGGDRETPRDREITPDRETPHDRETTRRRQAIYWRTLAATFDSETRAGQLPGIVEAIAEESDLPDLVTDREVSTDALLQRYPELDERVEGLVEDPDPDDDGVLERDLLYSKLLIDALGGVAGDDEVTAAEYNRWSGDVRHFERALGYQPGELLTPSGRRIEDPEAGPGRTGTGSGAGPGTGTGAGPRRPDSDGEDEGASPAGVRGVGLGSGGGGPLVSEEELRRGLEMVEAGIVDRIELREALQDRELTDQITPSMPMVEQLLHEKDHLSDEALENARRLVDQYVRELKEVLETAVAEAETGTVDRDHRPKRTFRNLDVERTVWQNLPNWDPDEEKLYVDQLYFEPRRSPTLPSRIVVVVDQSGSMVDSMVNCTILASIFAGLPNVDAHLLAYDTEVLDLSEYVDDPMDVLMRTDLGGGTAGMVAMPLVKDKVRSPERTAIVWISDFYDGDRRTLFDELRDLHEAGATLIPVGSVTSSGYQSVDSWTKRQFEELGTPLISGSVDSLIREIKEFVG